MKYQEQLLKLILDEDDDAIMKWILQQPLLDHPEILRELKQLVEELARDYVKEGLQGFQKL